MSAPLCAACSEARSRWLDYRLPRARGFAFGSGAPYDISPAGIRDQRRARFEEWRETIRFHRQLIADACRTGHHVNSGPAPARVIQLDLFAEFDRLEGAA